MKYKTFEELKEELGDKFEEYMYGANINLLTIIDKAIELVKEIKLHYQNHPTMIPDVKINKLLEILKGENK